MIILVDNIVQHGSEDESEILELAFAAGYTNNYLHKIELKKYHTKHFLNEKKIDNLKILIEEKNCKKIIFSDVLRSYQIANLEELLDVEIMDKVMLVLEIFENKANTTDIKLQVEMAKLIYAKPKAGARLSEAVMKERVGFGAGGEQVGSVMISDIQNRIKSIEKKINEIKKQSIINEIIEIPKIPIVGYYSAGKSTLFNILTSDERETSKDAFTTMVLKTGRCEVTGYPIDIIDTVGLVSLPNNVMSAFDLMLNKIFSFNGIISCINISKSEKFSEIQINDFLKYVEKFNIEGNVRVLFILTKVDLVDEITIKNVKENIHNLEVFDDYEIIVSRSDRSDDIRKNFIRAFESLFEENLTEFYYQNLQPSIASKLHNIARVDEQIWNSDGTTSMSGIGPTNLLEKIKGEFI